MDHVLEQLLRLITHYLLNKQPTKWEDIKDDKALKQLVYSYNKISEEYYLEEYQIKVTAKELVKEYIKDNNI